MFIFPVLQSFVDSICTEYMHNNNKPPHWSIFVGGGGRTDLHVFSPITRIKRDGSPQNLQYPLPWSGSILHILWKFHVNFLSGQQVMKSYVRSCSAKISACFAENDLAYDVIIWWSGVTPAIHFQNICQIDHCEGTASFTVIRRVLREFLRKTMGWVRSTTYRAPLGLLDCHVLLRRVLARL